MEFRFNLQRFADTEIVSVAPALVKQAWAEDTWSAGLHKAFFDKFTGGSPESIIQIREELSKDDGDTINIPLLMPLTGDGIEGDDMLEGNEEAMIYRDFKVTINQLRHAVRIKIFDKNKLTYATDCARLTVLSINQHAEAQANLFSGILIVSACKVNYTRRRLFMTDIERKLLAENAALKRENERLQRKILETTTEVPAIETIDATHAKFNGQVFAKTKKGHFYRAVSLHESVWRFYFGDIPDGYVIHHRNGDKGDNRIENLQIMTAAEHRAWHNQHDKISYRCDFCGKEIEKYHTSRYGDKHFCDAQCWGRYIHANKIYYEERTCVICGEKFSVYKYRKTQTCSPPCHHELISRSKRKKSSS